MVTLKQLEAFFWAAELGGLDPAAQRLNTTQSAISKRLQELESVLGMALFDRSRRRAQITPQGERLLALARDMLATRDRILDLSNALTPAPRTLRLGVTELTAMTWLPALIQRIRGSHPQVTLEPVVDTSVHLIDRVRDGRLDLAVVPDAFRETRFEVVPMDAVEYAWMCSPAYLGDVDALPLRELARYTIIVQLHASGLGDMVDRWLKDNHVQIENSLSSSNLTALANSLKKNTGTEVLIVGHTDSDGSDSYNQGLSERRASAARSYLISQGVASNRIRISGRGESEPIESNATADGRAQNRRVEVAIFAGEQMRRDAGR